MKKNIIVFLLIVVVPFFLSFCFVKAETTDTKPPVLNSFEIINSDFIGGEKVLLSSDIYDDISGVKKIVFSFIEEDLLTYEYYKDYEIIFNPASTQDGYLVAETKTLEKDTSYKIYSITISDKAGNTVCYTTSDNNDNKVSNCEKKLESFKINVKGSAIQKLDEFTINKTDFELGEKVNFEATVKDPSNVGFIQINYINENYTNDVSPVILTHVEGTNKYIGEMELQYVGKYEFLSVTITDARDYSKCEEVTYGRIVMTGDCVVYNTLPDDVYELNVKGERVVDTIFPELTNLTIETKNIQAPGFLKVKVYTKDDKGIKSVSLNYGQEKNFSLDDMTASRYNCEKIIDNEYLCNVEVDQYTEPGEYKIRNVEIRDINGNVSEYYYGEILDGIVFEKPEENDGHGLTFMYRKLKEYTFKIEQNVNSDVTSSTISNDLLDKINNSSDNAVISIDCTNDTIVKKEIFDAIKGTNKTISIETNGIQWIFRGKDILNETKDINVSSNISIVDTSTESQLLNKIFAKISVINISFHSNGLLPGIAKIRVKADYTFRDVVGTKNLFVFYLDESNGKIRYISKTLNMTNDGYYEFYIEHNSKYLISNEKPKQEYVNTSTIDQKIEKLNNSTSVKENIDTNNKPIEEIIKDKADILEKENSNIDSEINKEPVDIVEDNFEEDNKNNDNTNKNIKITKTISFIVIIILILFIGFIKYNKKLNVNHK